MESPILQYNPQTDYVQGSYYNFHLITMFLEFEQLLLHYYRKAATIANTPSIDTAATVG